MTLRIVAILASLLLGACSFDPQGFSAFDDAGSLDAASFDANNLSANSSTPNGSTPNNATSNNASPDGGNANVDPGDAGRDAEMLEDMGAPDMGPTMCNGRVVDLQTSNQHCGACGNACDADYGQCRRGECACIDPYGACGDDNRCTDKLIDPSNCGVCGFACTVGQFCNQGTCACLPGLTLCGNECVDTTRDPRHCGGCNTPCEGNACRDSACRQGGGCGAFVFECPIDGGVQCVSDPSSPLNCDASILNECGEVCDGTEICFRDDLIEPRRCRTYRPARGCVNCPCSDCSENGEDCTVRSEFPGKPVCVASP